MAVISIESAVDQPDTFRARNASPRDRRRWLRVPMNVVNCHVAPRIKFLGLSMRGRFHPCCLRDISLGGFNFHAVQEMNVGDPFQLVFEAPITGCKHRIDGVIMNRRAAPVGVTAYGCESCSELDNSLINYIVREALSRNLALRLV